MFVCFVVLCVFIFSVVISCLVRGEYYEYKCDQAWRQIRDVYKKPQFDPRRGRQESESNKSER